MATPQGVIVSGSLVTKHVAARTRLDYQPLFGKGGERRTDSRKREKSSLGQDVTAEETEIIFV